MWKIIKNSVEKIILNKQKFTLWMKWEFKIEFATDSFGPYNFKFEREDCYFIDWLEDRWSFIFPLKNKSMNNTEIFLETDNIVIAIWERWGLTLEDKAFIDVINTLTEKKYRIFTDEVNLIYNSDNSIILNLRDLEDNKFKTIELDTNTLIKKSEKQEELLTFFKSVYNVWEQKWYLLDFIVWDESEKDEEKKYKKWYFTLKEANLKWKPKTFNRKEFSLTTNLWNIDIWEESKK